MSTGQIVREKPLGIYGDEYTSQVLPGDGWRQRHDALKWALADICRSAHWTVEVEPSGLFAKSVPPSSDPEEVHKSLQNILPDLLVLESTGGSFWIADVKGVYSRAKYTPGLRDKKPRHAVNLRASQVNNEYIRKATAADRKHNSTPDGVSGPIAKELASYPPVRGLAFGSFFEASDSVDHLVASAAKAEADYEWKNLGGASYEAAYSAFFSSPGTAPVV